MRLFGKIVLILLAVFLVILFGFYFFLLAQGKSLFIKKLSRLTQQEVAVGYFGVKFPLVLEIRGLEIGAVGRAESVQVSLNAAGFISNKIILNDITLSSPQIFLEKSHAKNELETNEKKTEKAHNANVSPYSGLAVSIPEVKKRNGAPIIIRHINVKGGKVVFTDNTVGDSPLKIIIKDINLNLSNLYLFKHQAITDFDLTGKIPWLEGQEEGKLEFNGWVNLDKKDMQAVLKIKDIDGIYLYPYCKDWIDLEKARIQKAKLGFTSNMQGLNNNLSLNCNLELNDITFKSRLPEEQAARAERVASTVLDMFKTMDQGRVVLNFTINTKMDKLEFGNSEIQMAFEDKIMQARRANSFGAQDVAMLPGRVLEGTFKGAADLTKAALVGTFSVGKGIGKILGDAFRREPKTEEN